MAPELRDRPGSCISPKSSPWPSWRMSEGGVSFTGALVLAAVGIYGVISYFVSERTHEIGIPMALGAAPSDVPRLVLGQGLVMILIGLVLGLAGSLLLTRYLANLLYGVRPFDPLTIICVAVLLALSPSATVSYVGWAQNRAQRMPPQDLAHLRSRPPLSREV
jgi:predicted lysophospholipase L1 biosynthesis ABC-type transport system permease subunit